MKAIVLLSGGLDSTTVAAHALKAGYEVRGLCIGYGQRHARELDSARNVAARLGIPLHVADASFYADLASYSALTGTGAHAVPTARDTATMADGVPITYVPLRNTFFVTARRGRARKLDARPHRRAGRRIPGRCSRPSSSAPTRSTTPATRIAAPSSTTASSRCFASVASSAPPTACGWPSRRPSST